MGTGVYLGGGLHGDTTGTGSKHAVEREVDGVQTPTNDHRGQGGGASLILGYQQHFGDSKFGYDLSVAIPLVYARDWDGMQYKLPAQAGDTGFLAPIEPVEEIPNDDGVRFSTFSSLGTTLRPSVTFSYTDNISVLAGPLVSFRHYLNAKAPMSVEINGTTEPLKGTTPINSGIHIGGALAVIFDVNKLTLVPYMSYERGLMNIPHQSSPLKGTSHFAVGAELRIGLSLFQNKPDPQNSFPKDKDGDGLSNADERRWGSKPKDKDTDGDTILDGNEEFDLDVGEPMDTDHDGVINLLDPDDDGDGIPTRTEVMDKIEFGIADVDIDGAANWLDTDSDGDGVLDGDERVDLEPADGILDYLQKPAEEDADSDGLPDHFEDILRTDPNNPDTDGDGLTDGQETLGSAGSPPRHGRRWHPQRFGSR